MATAKRTRSTRRLSVSHLSSTNMADSSEASRRREIRRKKILDNSEDRLNRLLGHGGARMPNRDGHSHVSSQISTTADSDVSEGTQDTTYRSISAVADDEMNHGFQSQLNSTAPTQECRTPSSTDTADDEAMILPNLCTSGVIFSNAETTASSTTSYGEFKLSEDINTLLRRNVIGSDFLENFTLTNNGTTGIAEMQLPHQFRPVSQKKSPTTGSTHSNLTVIRRILYVIAAILWRLLLLANCIPEATESAIYPFLLLALTIMSYDALYVEQKVGTIGILINLVCSIFFSGVSVSKIDMIGKFLVIISKILEDIAVYLFTFFLCHWCVEKLISVE